MAENVTLELSDEIARRAREEAHATGRRIEEVLTAWIEHGVDTEPDGQMFPVVEHTLLTPYGNADAARILLEVLCAAERAGNSEGQAP